MKIVYLSGKITGLSEAEYMLYFKNAELKLKQMGYRVINPARRGEIPGYKWEDYMKDCIKELCGADLIYHLPNWQESEGAKMEHYIAAKLKIPELEMYGEKK